MRNLLVVLMGALLAASFMGSRRRLSAAENPNFKAEKKLLKSRQKEERKALKTQSKYQKQSIKEGEALKGVRLEAKHQQRREARALREKQKNELQELKDRQRIIKEGEKGFF